MTHFRAGPDAFLIRLEDPSSSLPNPPRLRRPRLAEPRADRVLRRLDDAGVVVAATATAPRGGVVSYRYMVVRACVRVCMRGFY